MIENVPDNRRFYAAIGSSHDFLLVPIFIEAIGDHVNIPLFQCLGHSISFTDKSLDCFHYFKGSTSPSTEYILENILYYNSNHINYWA